MRLCAAPLGEQTTAKADAAPYSVWPIALPCTRWPIAGLFMKRSVDVTLRVALLPAPGAVDNLL